MKNIMLLLIMGIFFVSFASAIDYTYPTNQELDLKIICYNNGYCSGSSYCNISVAYPNNTFIVDNQQFTNQNSFHNYTFSASQISLDGDYHVTGFCEDSSVFQEVDFFFSVREGGVEITEARSSLIMGLLFVLLIFFIASLIAFFKVEDYKGKFALYWLSHVLFVVLTFVGWQVGVEGVLGGTALTGIFRIMFYVSTVAMIPMIFLSLAWIFYIHTFNEHFEKLVSKGNDPETAFKLSKRKSGGWFNGK